MSKLFELIVNKFEELPESFLVLLIENDTLIHFIKNKIINIICAQLKDKYDYQELNQNYCNNFNLSNEEALNEHLLKRGMDLNSHKRNLYNSEKIKIIANNEFGNKAESEFLRKKIFLDSYVYSLISVPNSDIAHELYLQIESKEAEFSELAKKYSNEWGSNNLGVMGPTNLSNAHPLLREKILSSNVGELLNPLKIDNWWVVLRVEEKKEAIFDEVMKNKIVLSFFEEWINLLTFQITSRYLK